jgi:hypothetical protein
MLYLYINILCSCWWSSTGWSKRLCTWWLQYRKLQVMFKVSPASLQKFNDTPNCVLEDRVQYSTVRIPNVFCDGHLFFACFCTVMIRCTDTFWSPCRTYKGTGSANSSHFEVEAGGTHAYHRSRYWLFVSPKRTDWLWGHPPSFSMGTGLLSWG